MKKSFFLLVFVTLSWASSYAQFSHPGRGMYVDKFFRTAINTSGATIVNPNSSILGISYKEDSLLNYAKENHFTYLILYDLHYVLGNSTYESYLCSFIQKAKTQYCIEEIGAASSCSGMFDDIFGVSSTPAISFNDQKYSRYDTDSRRKLKIVEEEHGAGDSLFYLTETIKDAMRAMSFNDGCAYKIDVLVSEYEFWNATVDDCIGDSPSKDVRYQRYQALISDMDAVRDNYNIAHGSHQVYVETYLGYLNQNTAYTHQVIADWIDGSYAGKRRVDRINTHYYGQDPSRLYSRTAAGQNNSGYYLTRFLDFCQATTVNQSYLHPLFSSEYIPWGSGASYLGPWFSLGVNNNIFTAEKFFYNDWNDDAQNYHQSTVGSQTLGTIVHPGGVQWFTASKLVGHLEDPIMYTSNSPICVASGQNGTFQFQYQGPIEQGTSFKFYITNAGNSTIRCGTTNSIAWPVYNPITQTSIDLNTALGACSLPVGDYDAHLELTYSNSCSPYIVPLMRVSVTTTGKIVALTPTTVCQGHPLFLQAGSTGGGTTSYAWYDGTTAISGATSSTYAPNASSIGSHTYSCLITSSVGGCSANRSNVIPATINAFPTATITTLSSSSCSVTLQANPTGGTYLWHDASTGSTYTTSLSGTYSVAVTVNGCTSLSPKFTVSSLSGSGTVVPAVSIAANTGNNICSGTSVVFTATPSNGGTSPVYQWKKNGTNVGTNSITYSISTLANSDLITCVMTSNLSCASPATATSNGVTMTVNPNVTPAVSIVPSPGNVICTGTSVNFTATPVNGGAAPSYQWRKNGINVGTNNSSYTDNALVNNDVMSCIMTSNAACVTSPTATSGNINMTVSALVTPSVTISSNTPNPVCSGSNVIFTAVPVNGGAAPTYQWKLNGINAGLNSSSYSTSSLANNDVVSCVLTSNSSCVSTSNATSNALTIQVNSNLIPTVSISANTGSTICAGTNVMFTATPVNGGTSPAYQWKVNGNNTGSSNSTYSNGSLVNSDVVSCTMTSSSTCAATNSANSNDITMSVLQSVTPSLSIYSGQGTTVCSGVNISFTAAPVNGGTSPTYQWKKNGINVGTQNYVYSDNALVNSDVISCTMISNLACALPALVTSNNLNMVVNPSVSPSVTISSNLGTSICQGNNVTFTANTVNGGSTPSYHWKLNGMPTGGNINTYSNSYLANNDFVNCLVSSNANCAVPSAALSNNLTMAVSPIGVPTVTISSNTGTTICPGVEVLFSAAFTNEGISPSFQWKKNGVNVGFNSIYYTDLSISNNDVITCAMSSSLACASPSNVTSNPIQMNVVSNIVPSVTINNSNGINPICDATQVTFYASPVNGGNAPVYQWVKNGSLVGTNSSFYNDSHFLNNDVIYCLMTSSITCSLINPSTSNSISLNVQSCNPLTLNLKLFIQGYYVGNNKMAAVASPIAHPTLCDTVIAELHYATPPNNLVASVTDTMDINGNCKFVFPQVVLFENYYIAIRHRNALETWSPPVLFNSSSLNYDFTTAVNKAFGSNQADLGDGNFALWSGDVSTDSIAGMQDGIIDINDHIQIEKAVQFFNTGYLINDLTGDRIIESSDFSLIEHNGVVPKLLSRP